MKKITYLVGAGASCDVVPVVNDFHAKLGDLINSFNGHVINDAGRQYYFEPELIKCLKDLFTETENHASIDTYARKLFIKDEFEKLKWFKTGLTIIFLMFQVKNKFDKRYDKFWAGILNTDKSKSFIPDNFRILTWNYDCQFTRSFSNFIKSDSNYRTINNTPLEIMQSYDTAFSLVNLNGVIGFPWPTKADINENEFHKLTSNCFKTDFNSKEFITAFNELFNAIPLIKENLLSFAWEESDPTPYISYDHYFERIKDLVKGSEVLVVIGYSFPLFNRKVDKALLEAMNPGVIYVQDKSDKIEGIINKIENYFGINRIAYKTSDMSKFTRIKDHDDLSEFLIPPEFDI